QKVGGNLAETKEEVEDVDTALLRVGIGDAFGEGEFVLADQFQKAVANGRQFRGAGHAPKLIVVGRVGGHHANFAYAGCVASLCGLRHAGQQRGGGGVGLAKELRVFVFTIV